MPTQIIAGRVNSDGTVAGGSGFYVRPLGGGTYIIEFEQPLHNVPTVVLKQNYKDWNDFDFSGGNTRDNVVLVAVDQKGFEVITGDKDGNKVDRNFAFIAAVVSTQDTIPPIIWGDINADATTHSGSGFETTGVGDGTYLVDFDQPLDDLVSLVVTQNYKNWEDFDYDDGKTVDNAVIVAAKASQFKYITGGAGGDKKDRNCSFVAVGKQNGTHPSPRFLFGNVMADGTPVAGTGSGGFKVKKDATGTYSITFDAAFSTTPAMLLTQNYKDWTDFRFDDGDTRDNAVLVAIKTNEAEVITGKDDGSKVDRNFSFLVVG